MKKERRKAEPIGLDEVVHLMCSPQPCPCFGGYCYRGLCHVSLAKRKQLERAIENEKRRAA